MVDPISQADTEAPAFVPIQRQRAFEAILVQLQNQILRGELRPGDRLPNERALAEMLGVGRPSVREALRVLEALEIIEVRPGAGAASGSIISARTGEALSGLLQMHLALGHFTAEELVDTRRVLETSIVRTAAINRTEQQLRAIEQLLLEMEHNERERPVYLALDAEYHQAIAQAAGNALLTHLMQALRAPVVHLLNIQTDAWEDWDAVIAWAAPDHRALYEAIASRDPDAAERALAHHLAFYAETPPVTTR